MPADHTHGERERREETSPSSELHEAPPEEPCPSRAGNDAVALLEAQRRVLEMVATRAPLPQVLATLIRQLQERAPGMLGSILLLDEAGIHLRHCVAPDLPPEFVQAIDGSAIGPEAGSCGTAAWRREPVIVKDIATDPLWANYRHLALPHGLRACWSTPIFSPEKGLLGTFAMYYREPAGPLPEHRRLVETATHISAIAIGHERDQEALRQSREKLLEAQRLARIGYWDRDLRHGQLILSPETAEMFGVPAGRPISEAALEALIHPDDRQARRDALTEALAKGGKPYDVEYRVLPAHGPLRYVHVWDQIERDEEGRPVRMFGIVQDVTERRQVEAELRESHRLRSLVMATLPVGVAVTDREGNIILVNDALTRMWGGMIKPGEVRWARMKAYWHATGQPLAPEDWASRRALLHGETSLDELIDVETFDGARKTIRNFAAPVRDADEQIIGAIFVNEDVTERERALEALRESEHRFREVTESIDEVFWLKDTATGRTIYVSPAYEAVWGRSRETVLQEPGAWLAAVHPDDFERVESAVARQLEAPYDLEYRIVRPDGSVRWIHDRAFLVRDGEGRVYRVSGVADDITAHRRIEEQLREVQKMEAVGRLAGGIAHDFNNVLAVIQMNSSLLLDERLRPCGDPLSPAARESVQDIVEAADRAASLTRQLLTFGRRDLKQAKNLELAEVIGAMIKLLRRTLGEDVALETRFASALPVVSADPGMIEQIIMNLAINARDAMPEGGRLSVALDRVEVGGERAAAHPGVTPGPFVCLTVSDTGTGIAPENLPHLFEPFFTTKEVGKGTGLGLATVFGIVEQHRGWIEVESQLGHGTTFRVFLPVAAGAPAAPATPAARPRGGDETILVVEDEDPLRVIARMVLEQHGYRVLTAGSAAEAITIWEKHRDEIQLLLTDLVMPGGISGRQLAERLRADEPGLEVIYTSGYSEEIVGRHLQVEPGVTFLQKPYGSGALLAIVRQSLDQPGGG